MRVVPCFVLLVFLAGSVRPAAAAEGWIEDGSCDVMHVVEKNGSLIYPLARGFLRAGSDSVWTRGGPLRAGVDYTLDRLRGTLRLLREPLPGDTLFVRACGLVDPPPLGFQIVPRRFGGERPDSAAADTTLAGSPVLHPRPVTARDPNDEPTGVNLSLTGNKTVAVDFGSRQDAFLRQSLDLSLSGTLAPGVELTGVLSDQSTPLTLEGSTEDLQSIDRVLVELKTPNGGGALGDIPVRFDEGEFGRIDRRVQGVMGHWNGGGFSGAAAAASEAGEFRRVEFRGVDGRQGPYDLPDASGRIGVSIVAGSDVVTFDGVRLARGETADYSMDYDRGTITFTNRRPVTADSRIAVQCQFAARPYPRNLAAVGGAWKQGAWSAFTRWVTEADDRGRPLDFALEPEDRLRLAAIGDSLDAAVSGGVRPGGGDYDTVRVGSELVYAFAGRDSGDFEVSFSRVGAGEGDYADSVLALGVAYRYVGSGLGAYRIGRDLPLPEQHRLGTFGAAVGSGVAQVEFEGAMSTLDRNTFSAADDGDNQGGAGRVRASIRGKPLAWLEGTGIEASARFVEERFAPFAPLEAAFAEDGWGLPAEADLEHPRRGDVAGYIRPRGAGELRAEVGELATPDGFDASRTGLTWTREGAMSWRAGWTRAASRREGWAYDRGSNERVNGEWRWRLPYLEPALLGDWSERVTPGIAAPGGERWRDLGFELATGAAIPWRLRGGWSLRRSGVATPTGFLDRNDARTLRLGLDSPRGRMLQAAVLYQRRELIPLADSTSGVTDLASLRLSADRPGGATGRLNIEVTSEAETRRVRRLVFVGTGNGAYDPLGNPVGSGDYDLVLETEPGRDPLARATTSAQFTMPLGRGDVWRGSRAIFDYETEARRRGDLAAGDAFISPGAALADPALARGVVLQRLTADLAPASPIGGFVVRAERRVSADRTYQNFAQTLDDRSLTARWRIPRGKRWGGEVEGRAKRQSAEQALLGASGFARTLDELGGLGRVVVGGEQRVRVTGTLEGVLTRPAGALEATRTIRAGGELAIPVGARGRGEISARRHFFSGPALLDLLPTADPLGTLRWDGGGRFDYRVRDGIQMGVLVTVTDRVDRRASVTGRGEVRAFF